MKYLKTSIYLFIAICLGACSNSVDIVENGNTNYAIIIAQQPNEQESRAASLLQEYIEKMTGCKIPITNKLNKASEKGIFIKEVKGLQWDGYAIKTSKDGNIFIDGGKFRGCVYGVVEILEKYLGCHVYTAKYKVIPQINDISLSPLNISDSSINYCRIVHFHSNTISDQDVLDWCRISTGSVDYIGVHSLTNSLVPWRKYFDSHPEYFAWRNSDGKRMPTQACVSNKEVLRIVIEELEQKMALNPQNNYWDVSQDDNRAYCECEACKKIIDEEKSPGGPTFRFVNEVARHFPDKIISTLAYQYSRPAPVVTKPLDNVRIVLCSIEADRSRSIVEDTSSVGRSFVKDLEDWGKICKQIYLWDYIVNFHYYLAPFPNLHTLQPNIKLFVDNNVHEHFQQANVCEGHEFTELKLYLSSRLLWDYNIDMNSTINEFLVGYYGDAAPMIRKYIDRHQEELINSGEQLGIFEMPTISLQNTVYSENNMVEYFSYLDNAEALVKDQPDFLDHVHAARLQLQYATMEIGKVNMYNGRGWYDNSGIVRSEKMDEILDGLYTVSKKQQVPRFAERGGFTPDVYYEMSKYTSDVQVQGNYAFRKKVTGTPDLSSIGLDRENLSLLTDGIRGNYCDMVSSQWALWKGTDVELLLDMESSVKASTVEVTMLTKPDVWGRLLLPVSVECLVSKEKGIGFVSAGTITTKEIPLEENEIRPYTFDTSSLPDYQYVKLKVKGTIHTPAPHPAAGAISMVGIDEIVVN